MNSAAMVRLALGVFPISIAVAAVLFRKPSRRVLAGTLLAIVWNAWALLAVNAVAVHFGWWRFDPALPAFMGVAIEPWLGWVVLWGAFVPIVALDRPFLPTLFALLWFDLIAMPLLEPVLQLGPGWVLGEGVVLAVSLVPSFFLARWTAAGTHLTARGALQVVCAAAVILWVVPSVAFSREGGWGEIAGLPGWRRNLGVQALLVPAALGVRAVAEFVRRGEGTPIPFDPPRRLVTTGPYAFVRNPMQLAMVMIFGILAAVSWNPWLAAASVVAFAYGAGLAQWHEGLDLTRRFGHEWSAYRDNVRAWLPRRRPYLVDGSVLFVAFSCSTCSSIGRWFLARDPFALRIEPAEDAEDRTIRRITYMPATGPHAHGVAAVAHALEHLHLGWAIVGWVLLLPGVRQFAQLLADLFGPTPGRVAGRPYDAGACRV